MEIINKQELYQTSWSQNKDTDFIGFSFNGKHSSELGIVRTSNGSRYDDNLLPTSQDKTAVVPGGDGTYYWGTNYTQKPFSIPIAFDSLTEEQYRQLRQHFNTKELGRLIFDESPYKYYMAKPTGTPQLKTICFEIDGARIYKGEGTIQFTAYYPYAKSVHKWLNEYDETLYPNKDEWAGASGMLSNRGPYDGNNANTINLYNPGDIETDFCLYFNISGSGANKNLSLSQFSLSAQGITTQIIKFKTFEFEENNSDTQIRVNTKTNLIEGVKSDGSLSGTLYNKFIESGDFFKIPLGESSINANIAIAKIEYEYIYY